MRPLPFPDAHRQIDWTHEHVFLDQELRQVVRDAELGRRFVDKLVRVTRLGGGEGWVYVHVEVQGSREADFARRIFVYNYRLFDRYDRPVASLAVLADQDAGWKPDHFHIEGERKVRYVTSVERLTVERGMQQGMEKGRIEGEGTILRRLLTRRFGPLPQNVLDRLACAESRQLETWADRVINAASLDEVFADD
ncbi:DUF4351 domain-containing protein [Aromatoleum bremense]|uniref:DUF4351 domain-containing protein n=1 Tax=Aromatoleum bremense TaxID=76115 RepID=A0ABX1NSP9_9RHOO|nr:DUF4351 domain-containing protein [Aromatoleum bremense]NMG15025.1 DUF4351 domain-containing protein [Aromatoleum bremense]QTQ32267.1 putative protein DUf4351 [Aromatoleum bremense]